MAKKRKVAKKSVKKVSKKSDASLVGKLLSFLAWLTGIVVSLAVGFGLIDGVLNIRFIPLGITVFFGWVVVITVLLGVLLAIIKQFE